MGGQVLLAAIAVAVLLGACTHQPPAARPREGAPVTRPVQVAGNDRLVAVVPPTLAPVAVVAATPTPTAPSPTLSPTMAPTHVIASTGGMPVNMRAGPSMAAPVIMTLREGTPIEALGDPVSAEGRSWQQIRSNDRQGWVVAVVVRQR